MDSELKLEDLRIQIRNKLRIDQIKLWLEPYFEESNGPSVKHLQTLANDYSSTLELKYDLCYKVLLDLQSNSLENLKQRDRFKNSGLATLKVKVLHSNSPPRVITKEIMLTMLTGDFKDLISQDISIPSDRFKLISNGKVLKDNESLVAQDVKNGQLIMAITIVESKEEVLEKENKIKEIEGVKTDSKLLALDSQYMQLEDQFGNPVKIPAHEKRSLIVAMTLHEKGKSCLKKDDFSKALIYFLEADEEFQNCNSKLLNLVDNYALLDLDIAWCYLCLQSVANLPEAFERLKRCEDRFHKSYGENLERLIAVKGTPGNEAALFMRLHLLQAIILYHQNNRDEALNLLLKAQQELTGLKVDENSVISLVELGFTMVEARIGLRATKGDVNHAANYINENREKRKESRRKALAEEILEKERKILGKCADGKQYVDPNFLKILVNMGYNKEAGRIALQKCNNIISDSIQYIQENPCPGPSGSKSEELLKLVEDLLPELVSAGFDTRMAKLGLLKYQGDVMKAAEELLANNGIIEGDLSLLDTVVNSKSLDRIKQNHEEKKQEAFTRLTEDITMVDDDYLDLTLQSEERFLNQYLDLLQKKP